MVSTMKVIAFDSPERVFSDADESQISQNLHDLTVQEMFLISISRLMPQTGRLNADHSRNHPECVHGGKRRRAENVIFLKS